MKSEIQYQELTQKLVNKLFTYSGDRLFKKEVWKVIDYILNSNQNLYQVC